LPNNFLMCNVCARLFNRDTLVNMFKNRAIAT